MLTVLTKKVLFTVNAMLDFLEMDIIVQVRSTSILEVLRLLLSSNASYYDFIDIDECKTNPCHSNASCTDNEGSFDCQCNSGFSGDGHNCTSNASFSTRYLIFTFCLYILFNVSSYYFEDFDECLNTPCHSNASCTDNEGSFDCQCNVGFSGNGLSCTSKINIHIYLGFRIYYFILTLALMFYVIIYRY